MAAPLILAALAGFGADRMLEGRAENRQQYERSQDVDNYLRTIGATPEVGPIEPGLMDMLTSESADIVTAGHQVAQSRTPAGLLAIQQAAEDREFTVREKELGIEQAEATLEGTRNTNLLAPLMFEKEMLALEGQRLANASSQLALETAQANDPFLREIKKLEYLAAAENLDKARRGDPIDLTKPVGVVSQYTGQPTVAYLPGTKEHNNQQAELDQASNLTSDVTKYWELVDQVGSELWDDEKQGQLEALHTTLIPRISQVGGSGTPQAAEIELYSKMIPTQTGWWDQFNDRTRGLAAIAAIETVFGQIMLDRAQRNPFLRVNYDAIPASVAPPSVVAKWRQAQPSTAGFIQ